MSILVVGSVAYDTLETPAGKRENILGGTATHFSAAASFFTKVHLVGVVGGDFKPEHIDFLKRKDVDISGLEIVKSGKTFHWAGHYLNNLNEAETLDTKLGVFEHFNPVLSEVQRELPILFLGNIHPQLQLKVLDQMNLPQVVALDTMNLWINNERDALQQVIERVNMMIVNDGEARLLTGENNMTKAAMKIKSWGPKTVVIKRGEYGALLFHEDEVFVAPALPLADVTDPTGAGDSFAGGFLGCLSRAGEVNEASLKRAAILGSVMASFHVEDFGPERHNTLQSGEIEERFAHFKQISTFEHSSIFA